MKKLGLLKVAGVTLFTLTAAFASDASKWDSIQNLDSFVQFLINDKASKINDIDKILDHLKANAPDRFNAICGPVKAGQNVKNNIREWEAPYNTTLSQQKISKINFKCMNTVVDTNLRPQKMELQPLDDMAKFDAPPVPEAPKVADLPPRVPSPKPAAPAPQMSLDDMMDAEISGSWEESDSPSVSKAPSRSSTPEPQTLVMPKPLLLESLPQDTINKLQDFNAESIEEKIVKLYVLIPIFRGLMVNKSKELDAYLQYLKTPPFEQRYGNKIVELEGYLKKFNDKIELSKTLAGDNQSIQTINRETKLGKATLDLDGFKNAMVSDLAKFPDSMVLWKQRQNVKFDSPGRAERYYYEDFGVLSMPEALKLLKSMKSKYKEAEKIYVDSLNEFIKEYNDLKNNNK